MSGEEPEVVAEATPVEANPEPEPEAEPEKAIKYDKPDEDAQKGLIAGILEEIETFKRQVVRPRARATRATRTCCCGMRAKQREE